jgi:hypothetical protein
MNFLHNVSAFMRKNQAITVDHRPGPKETWPVHIKLGSSGDSLDVWADVENARRLRDKLIAALDGVDE